MCGGKSSTKKTNQTSTTTPANPAVSAGYSGLIQSAEQLASKPYQPYTGELTAPVSPVQNNAITGIANSTQQAQPLLNQAAGFAAQSATPLTAQQYSPAAIAQYESPYTQSVVDATQAQFAKSNAQQQAQLQGGTAAAGALGGDRAAILQSELAGQQNAAQAPTIANLYNTGFGNAQTEFNNQQGVGLSTQQANNTNAGNAGYALSNIGLGQENASLSGYGAELGAGALEQQTQQAGDTANYNQFLQAQGYPYQSLDFLGSILANASSGAGTTSTGTSNSTSTTPFNPFSLIGLGNPYRAGGRTRLDTGGFAPVQSYVPDVQATPPQMMQAPKGFDSTGDDGSDSSQGGGGGSNKAGGLLQLAMAFLADGGRARLADGGFAPVVTDYPNIRSYIPAVQATPPQMHGMSADSSNDNSNGPNYGSGSGGGGVFGQNGFFGSGQNGQGGGFDTVVKDASSAGDDVMSFLSALASGGRTRLSGGGFARLADGGIDGLDMDSGDGADAYSLPNLMALINASGGVPQPTGAAPPGDFVAPTPTPRPDQSDDTTTTIAPPASGFAPISSASSGDDGAYTLPTDANDVSVASVPAQDAPSAALATGFAPVGASALSVGDTPAPWRDIATNYADTQTPVWDDGTPVDPTTAPSPGQGGGFGPVNAGTPAFSVAPNKPDIWQSVLSGLGGFLSHGTIGAGINAGLADYENQRDPHPQLDHSGSTVMLSTRGGDGSMKVFDTGIPTEASLNRQSTQQYHDDAIAAANARATESVQERAAAAAEAARQREFATTSHAYDQWNQLNLTRAQNGMAPLPMPPDLAAAMARANNPATASGASNADLPAYDPKKLASLVTLGGGRTGNESNLAGLDPTFGSRLQAMLAEYNQKTGSKAQFNSGTRTAADQAWMQTHGTAPAAPVGTSTHEDGTAADLNSADVARMDKLGLFQKYGLQHLAGNEYHHVQLAPQPVMAGSQPAQTPQVDPNTGLPADANLHGDAFLKTLDPTYADLVRATVQGRQPFPSGFSWRSPQGQAMMRAAAQYEPGFDATLFDARKKAQTEMSNTAQGHMGANISSFNTAIRHAVRLNNSIDALGNHTLFPGVTNSVHQYIGANTDPAYQDAIARFGTDKQALVDELTRAFRGTGGNVHDLVDWEKKLSDTASPVTLHSVVAEGMQLLKSRIDSVEDQYRRGTRTTLAPGSFLAPDTRQAFNAITGKKVYDPNAPSNGPAPDAAAPAPARPAAAAVPQRPTAVPAGSQYSPSRKMWRDGNNRLYNAAGQPVQ